MSSARSMWSGFLVFLICSVTALIMFFALGTVVDNVSDQFYISGFYDLSDNPEWEGSYGNTTAPMINIFYFALYLIPILGLAVFILSIFRRYWSTRR